MTISSNIRYNLTLNQEELNTIVFALCISTYKEIEDLAYSHANIVDILTDQEGQALFDKLENFVK